MFAGAAKCKHYKNQNWPLQEFCSKLYAPYPIESARCDQELVYNEEGYANDRGTGQHPADHDTPVGILVLLAQHILVAEEREDADDHQEDGTNVLPADAPEDARMVAQHLVDVVREILHAIEPEDARRLHEHDKQNRQSGPVHIQEVHQIDAALRKWLRIN